MTAQSLVRTLTLIEPKGKKKIRMRLEVGAGTRSVTYQAGSLGLLRILKIPSTVE